MLKAKNIYVKEEPSALAGKIGFKARQARCKGLIKKCKMLTNSVVLTDHNDETLEVETLEEFHDAMLTLCDGSQLGNYRGGQDPLQQQVAAATKESIQLDLINQLKQQGVITNNVDPQAIMANLSIAGAAPSPMQTGASAALSHPPQQQSQQQPLITLNMPQQLNQSQGGIPTPNAGTQPLGPIYIPQVPLQTLVQSQLQNPLLASPHHLTPQQIQIQQQLQAQQLQQQQQQQQHLLLQQPQQQQPPSLSCSNSTGDKATVNSSGVAVTVTSPSAT